MGQTGGLPPTEEVVNDSLGSCQVLRDAVELGGRCRVSCVACLSDSFAAEPRPTSGRSFGDELPVRADAAPVSPRGDGAPVPQQADGAPVLPSVDGPPASGAEEDVCRPQGGWRGVVSLR